MRPHFKSVFDLQMNNSDLFVLKFVISGKVSSLPKVIKCMERSIYYFHDFSAKHTPSATLTKRNENVNQNTNSENSNNMIILRDFINPF